MPPLPTGTASCMKRPRIRTILAASAGVRPPTLTMALYSPREWPATTSRRVAPRSSSTAWIADDTARMAGCVFSVSFN